MSYLPDMFSQDFKNRIEAEVRNKLVDFRNESIDDFCKKRNICRICISGGYDCDLDHK